MMNLNGKRTHLIEDPTLGGLKREYVEVERKADVGDYVLGKLGHIRKVAVAHPYGGLTLKDGHGAYSSDFYKVLDPTDIVVHEGARYKLTDRQAEVGEKVVITEGHGWYRGKIGEIFSVINGENFGFKKEDTDDYEYIEHEDNKYGAISFIQDEDYLVLEPVESNAEPAEVTADQASPAVIELLGNLAQRIVELEREVKLLLREDVIVSEGVSNIRKSLDALQVGLNSMSDKNKTHSEEIDTLHTNQKRLGEELANGLAKVNSKTPFDAEEACGAIVELAKLLVESHRRESRREAK